MCKIQLLGNSLKMENISHPQHTKCNSKASPPQLSTPWFGKFGLPRNVILRVVGGNIRFGWQTALQEEVG
jgi:hypothetical protein